MTTNLDNGNAQQQGAEEQVLRDIDTVIAELHITDPLQDEWAGLVREHAASSKNDPKVDRLLYMSGYRLLARARLLGGIEQLASDKAMVARHLPDAISR